LQKLICARTRSSCAWMTRASSTTGVRHGYENESTVTWPVVRQAACRARPAFYVNGIRHDGSYDVDSLRSAVVGHLRSGSAPA
jgi:hypothetical protein